MFSPDSSGSWPTMIVGAVSVTNMPLLPDAYAPTAAADRAAFADIATTAGSREAMRTTRSWLKRPLSIRRVMPTSSFRGDSG
jgi:hypothetical protein